MTSDQHIMDFDAQLTAYALGELDPESAGEIMDKVANDPAAQAKIEEIRRAAALVSVGLDMEPAATLTDDQREAIASGPPEPLNSPVIFTMRRVAMIGMPLAACLALIVFIWPSGTNPAVTSDEEFAVGDVRSGEAMTNDAREGGARTLDEADVSKTWTGNVVVDDTAAAPMPESLASTRGDDAARHFFTDIPPSPGRQLQVDSEAPARGRDRGRGGGGNVAGGSGGAAGPGLGGRGGRRGGSGGGGALNSGGGRISPPGSGGGAIAPDREPASPPVPPDRTSPRRNASDDAGRQGDRVGHRNEQYDDVHHNPFVRTSFAPGSTANLSTFAIDVDTASYANIRRLLTNNTIPRAGAVRIEEMVNYFDYDYAAPTEDDEHPFSVHVEVNQAPWTPEHRLVKVGLKGREVDPEMRPATSLVFLLDVSGSMNSPAKLPLVQASMRMLVGRLNADDRIAIVTYAGNSGVVLDSTYCHDKDTILDAINNLRSGGGTNGAAGIELAYQIAQDYYIDGGVNRVILCTDGDFNVGASSDDALVKLIEQKRESNVFLSVFGFGNGNIKMAKMEKLSQHGNGVFGYIDSADEAKRRMVEDMAGMLVTIAKDVKIQVDFNPAHVAAYRLIGYENRMLAAEDFRDDKKDAGEIGAGHRVTALYEVIPVGVDTDLPDMPTSKYVEQPEAAEPPAVVSDDLLTVNLRYKQPEGDTGIEWNVSVIDDDRQIESASADFKFAAAVAGCGMVLRGTPDRGDITLDQVIELARAGAAAEVAFSDAVVDLNTLIRSAGEGRDDDARAAASRLVESPVSDAQLLAIVTGANIDETLPAILQIVDAMHPDAGLGASLRERLDHGLAADAADVPKRYDRAHFIDLVQRLKELRGGE